MVIKTRKINYKGNGDDDEFHVYLVYRYIMK